jgi:hypothetical protein
VGALVRNLIFQILIAGAKTSIRYDRCQDSITFGHPSSGEILLAVLSSASLQEVCH